MNPDKLRPEIRKIVTRLPRIPWSIITVGRLMYNLAMRTKVATGVSVSTEVHDGLEMIVYTPKDKDPKGAILWCHGGGHFAGTPEHLNSIASLAVKELGVAIFAPKYRLAPRHPFPADFDDCYKAWKWLTENAEKRGIQLNKLTIAGHSAGGGIAAALVQGIVDRGGVQPIAQCLFYPMLDDRIAADRSLDTINHFIWNNKANLKAWSAYLSPMVPGSNTIPEYAAPARRKNLKGLPPAWIGQCGVDLFLSENKAYAERLRQAGVKCEVYYVTGVPHAFELLIPEKKISRDFEMAAINFLKKALKI